MAHKLRYVPAGSLVEVTCRTVNSLLLLKPTRRVNETIVGIVGRAQRTHEMAIHTIVVQSNHLHMLVSPRDAQHLAKFMEFVNSHIARKVGKLVDWRGRLWCRRYTSIVVSEEEEAQVARLRYHLEHGAKENFVLSPRDWPGVHCAAALADGTNVLEGFWFDETKMYYARRRGENPGEYDFADPEKIVLSPLPCWSHLEPAPYAARVADMVRHIEEETIARHQHDETAPTGAMFVLQQDPHSRPRSTKRSPAPLFHTFRATVYDALYEAYTWFVVAYREAAELLAGGALDVEFPRGSFPPALPFVAA